MGGGAQAAAPRSLTNARREGLVKRGWREGGGDPHSAWGVPQQVPREPGLPAVALGPWDAEARWRRGGGPNSLQKTHAHKQRLLEEDIELSRDPAFNLSLIRLAVCAHSDLSVLIDKMGRVGLHSL